MKVIKRDKTEEDFKFSKIRNAVSRAFKDADTPIDTSILAKIHTEMDDYAEVRDSVDIEVIQDMIEEVLMMNGYPAVSRKFSQYRQQRARIRDWVNTKEEFIKKYKESSNTANATIDDNSNVASKNIAILNNEIHKEDNTEISRKQISRKIKELFPDFDSKQYARDLKSHIIYKHDESSFAGALAPYCCSISMYPFLTDGIKKLGGLSASPKNIDSFCGMYINLIFAVSSQFAGAVATPEFLMYFDYFARKEWGSDYYLKADDVYISSQFCTRAKTIKTQINQYFQQVVYSINQPSAARGMQAAFVNFAYFDEEFFYGMFGDFRFPDGSCPEWASLSWLQKEFMQWFNRERTKAMLTFPVESFALVYDENGFKDRDSADFVAAEYARGHSFFTYMSDTVDSLSSCCRLKNMVTSKEFNFTNGNMGVMTGSKSVITLNLNRIIQDWYKTEVAQTDSHAESRLVEWEDSEYMKNSLKKYISEILDRVYVYHTAYNELLWDMYDANLLPAYSAGFISLNKQYLTIGLNGLNQAAEYLGIKCDNNQHYREFCQLIFSTVKEKNRAAGGKFNGHSLAFNTEQVPAESLAVKNYNWDKADGYWVPEDTNLYASYIFKPNDTETSILHKIKLHGSDYIGEYLDGGAAAHINLENHLSEEQYRYILEFASEVGCQYLTFNVPNSECQECGWIGKQPVKECPVCKSNKIDLYDRVIGYLTKIRNWSDGRQQEQKTRHYHHILP